MRLDLKGGTAIKNKNGDLDLMYLDADTHGVISIGSGNPSLQLTNNKALYFRTITMKFTFFFFCLLFLIVYLGVRRASWHRPPPALSIGLGPQQLWSSMVLGLGVYHRSISFLVAPVFWCPLLDTIK